MPTLLAIRLRILTTLVFIAALLADVCVGQLREQAKVEPIVTTFCEVVRHSETWNGKLVRIRASVISDGMDHTALADPKCSVRITPRISEEASDRADVQQFTRSLFIDTPRGTAFKQVSATFTGTFVWDRRVRVLQIEQVKDLTVTKLK